MGDEVQAAPRDSPEDRGEGGGQPSLRVMRCQPPPRVVKESEISDTTPKTNRDLEAHKPIAR